MCVADLQCCLVLWIAKVLHVAACSGDYGSPKSKLIESTPRGCDADEMVCVCVFRWPLRLCIYVDAPGLPRLRWRGEY